MVSISLWRQKKKNTLVPHRKTEERRESQWQQSRTVTSRPAPLILFKPSCTSRREPEIKFPWLLDSLLTLSPYDPNCYKEQSRNHLQAFLPECRDERLTLEPKLATFTLIIIIIVNETLSTVLLDTRIVNISDFQKSYSFPNIPLYVPQINCLYLLSRKKKRLASLQFNLRSQATTHTHRTQPDILKKFNLKQISSLQEFSHFSILLKTQKTKYRLLKRWYQRLSSRI